MTCRAAPKSITTGAERNLVEQHRAPQPDACRTGAAPNASKADQGETGFWIDLLLQMHRCLSQDEFACGAHASFHQMTTMGAAISPAYDHMGMNSRLPVFGGHIADQREQLDLLVEIDSRLVPFRLPIEPGQFDVRECPNGSEAASCKPLLIGEFTESPDDFVARLEYENKGLGLSCQLLVTHKWSPTTVAVRQKRFFSIKIPSIDVDSLG